MTNQCKIALKISVLATAVVMLGGCATTSNRDNGLELTILHTNDTHSFAAGISQRSTPCLQDEICMGGYARLVSAVQEVKRNRENILFLDAGDTWQGTLFFKTYGPGLIEEFANVIGWDVATLGNHEFDRGCPTALDYVKALPMSVVAANLAHTQCPLSDNPALKPWVIRKFDGVSVGIVGLANDEVKDISKACDATEFLSPRASLQKAVDELKALGIRHIVAVTHLGYPADCELARTVTGVDVYVGGHTHDVLGDYPGSVGPYPTQIRTPDGSIALVVTAKRGTEFLGDISVRFDKDGNIAKFVANQKHLTPDMPRDMKVEKRVQAMAEHIEALRGLTVAHNALNMVDGLDACRESECLSAMITADAMLAFGRKYEADAAVINAGAVRDALPVGEVKEADIASIHPFNDEVKIRELTGQALLAAIEHGASDPKVIGPYILQPAGLRYQIDFRAPEGKRTSRAQILLDGQWRAIELNRTYRVVVNDYLDHGGDGFSMVAQGKRIACRQMKTMDLFREELRRQGEIKAPELGRIVWIGR
ncbi:MAG: bifunctional metallophosphatase/5'-nucleotidase [Sutterellaceae bacterium]|nr:bifunctional metallophosphatase/5'-nucleotidase [Sutterellaceae bacterium]